MDYAHIILVYVRKKDSGEEFSLPFGVRHSQGASVPHFIFRSLRPEVVTITTTGDLSLGEVKIHIHTALANRGYEVVETEVFTKDSP